MALPSWTDQQIIDQLNSGSKYSSQTITYSFAHDWRFDIGSPNGEINGFSELWTEAKSQTVVIMELWDDVIANDVSNVAPGAYASDIALGMTTTGLRNGYCQSYGPGIGAVWFHSGSDGYAGTNNLVTPVVGMNGFQTYIRETGHALGLNYMADYWTISASCFQDSGLYSVMSQNGPNYFAGEGDIAWADWVGSNGWNYSVQTPMMNDIMALQQIYGADTTTRTGDTVYGFNCNISDSSAAVFDFSQNGNPILCIYDAGGIDTLDLSGFSAASKLDLDAGSFSDCADMTYNVSIARNVTIENGVTGSGDDTLSGNSAGNALTGNDGADVIDGEGGDDWLTGGAGNDTLTGGEGDDTAAFSADWSALRVTYDAMTGLLAVTSSAEGTDTLSGIETIVDGMGVAKTASSFVPEPDPVFSVAAGAASVREGNSGATAYSFTVSLAAASAQTQSVSWTLSYGRGTGQADAADFTGAKSGTAVFDPGTTSKTVTVSVVGDTSVEADEQFSLTLLDPVMGTAMSSASGTIVNDDTVPVTPLKLTGTSAANTLTGAGGNDTLSGLLGNDTLSGMGGDDLIIGGGGYDRQTGGTGADRFDFDTAGQSAQISAITGVVGQTDVITDFVSGTDKIDLATVDASVRQLGNNAFTWLGTSAIGKLTAGELRYQQFDNAGTDNDYTMVYGDTDADTMVELAIKCTGLITFSATDFIM